MPDKTNYDTVLRNVRAVRPGQKDTPLVDIAILGEKIVAIGSNLDVSTARQVYDGKGYFAFPGVVDAHMHTGIYSPLAQDAVTESQAAAQGGVTSSLNYFRSGQYYLNKGGPYSELFPEALKLSAGNFHVDYAYHLAPVDSHQIKEIPQLIEDHGVTSYKIFMFYGGYGLHGASASQRDFLMIGEDENYDIAHFEFVMRGVQAAAQANPALAEIISLSLHCETAEIMNAYTKIVQREGKLQGLRAYSAARPPHSEGLAIFIAGYLANETNCLNINLLHLSSRKAVEAALQMAQVFPHVNFKREVTIGHLCLNYDSPAGPLAKVNPPIRSPEDVEYLWGALLEGKLDWVTSDHACCRHEMKVDAAKPTEIFKAKSGFGGSEWLLPALITEGQRRGLPMHRIAELTATNPAERFGLRTKGKLAPGFDADIALVQTDVEDVVHAADSASAQGYTPFEGIELNARVVTTFLRGQPIYQDGKIVGPARGKYLARPYG
jgi:allantoinase